LGGAHNRLGEIKITHFGYLIFIFNAIYLSINVLGHKT